VLFSVELGKKDLALAIAAAAETGLVLPTAGAIMEQMDKTLVDPELSDKDWAALAEVTIRSNELDS
jgi:3-hydroxyisobutyrate dehydrogenase-like beta-hydroxyacid dehydrogenase